MLCVLEEKGMEERRLSPGKVLLVFMGNLVFMGLTVFTAFNLEGYILETFGFLATLTYSVIGLFVVLIITVFIFRQESIPLKAAGLGIPFVSLYLFLKLILENDTVMILSVIIIASALSMTFFKLRRMSFYYSLAMLFLVGVVIVMEVTGLEIKSLLETYGLLFFTR